MILQIQKVSKTYSNGVRALKDVTLKSWSSKPPGTLKCVTRPR